MDVLSYRLLPFCNVLFVPEVVLSSILRPFWHLNKINEEKCAKKLCFSLQV